GGGCARPVALPAHEATGSSRHRCRHTLGRWPRTCWEDRTPTARPRSSRTTQRSARASGSARWRAPPAALAETIHANRVIVFAWLIFPVIRGRCRGPASAASKQRLGNDQDVARMHAYVLRDLAIHQVTEPYRDGLFRAVREPAHDLGFVARGKLGEPPTSIIRSSTV